MVPVPGDKPKALRDKKKRLIDAVKSMTSRAGVTLADLGIDPAIFEVGGGTPKTDAPAAAGGSTPKKMIWTPGGGLQEEE